MNESLFDEQKIIPLRSGRVTVEEAPTSKIFSNASGFLCDYDYTLNAYMGCQFGCAYCYATNFTADEEKRANWGNWVTVKTNATKEILGKRSLLGKKIYMSSVTDPYQPIEGKIGLTRSILELLVEECRQPRLVVQTRSPLAVRDIDLLKRFKHVRVNMTVTTDTEEVRKKFEPTCASNASRIEAIRKVKDSGVKVGICITPMLPLEDPMLFARHLASINADVYVSQNFHSVEAVFTASTRQMALDMAKEYNWTAKDYALARKEMLSVIPQMYEGRQGFMPE